MRIIMESKIHINLEQITLINAGGSNPVSNYSNKSQVSIKRRVNETVFS